MSESVPLPGLQTRAESGIGSDARPAAPLFFSPETIDPAIRRFSDPNLQPVALLITNEMLLGSIAAGDLDSVLHQPISDKMPAFHDSFANPLPVSPHK